MKGSSLLLWFSLFLAPEVFANISFDSTAKRIFPKLTEQIGLKDPDLNTDEYEVRIWFSGGLRYGDAQAAYVLRRTQKRFTAVMYVINSDGVGFRSAKRRKPAVTVSLAFWQRLLKQNILTLPNDSVVFNRLYPKSRPPSLVDTVQAGMQVDGSFTVKGTRRQEDEASSVMETFIHLRYSDHIVIVFTAIAIQIYILGMNLNVKNYRM